MLPYVAQGTANAIEDAAALAVALTCTPDVHSALALYEAVRKGRAEKIAASASHTGRTLYMLDGPEQEMRDESIRRAGSRDETGKRATINKWTDQEWQDHMRGVDVMRETVDKWNELDRRSKELRYKCSNIRDSSKPSQANLDSSHAEFAG